MRPTTTLYSFPVLLINAGLVATPKQPGNQRYMYTSAAAGMTTMVVGFAAWTAATLEAQGFDTLFALVTWYLEGTQLRINDGHLLDYL